MTAVDLSVLGGAGWQFFDDNGNPLSGGLLYTYVAGTTTPQTTYTSSDGSIPNSNPIILDAAGRVPSEIWLLSGEEYKFLLKSSDNVQIWVKDNISSVPSGATGISGTNGSELIGFIQTGAGAVLTNVQAKLREFVSVKDFGATGDGLTDDTAAIQTALNSGHTSIYFPEGNYGVSAVGAALTLAASDTALWGPGYITPLPNINGFLPAQTLYVTGSRNTISLNLWNKLDLSKPVSIPSLENPADGIRIEGNDNVVEGCQVYNFCTGVVVRAGYGHKVLNCRITTKNFNAIGWPNDGILWFITSNGICAHNTICLAETAATNVVKFEGVTNASTSLTRCGITVDSFTESVTIANNIVGEAFETGIHHEGIGDRQNLIIGNTVYKQRRNAINANGSRISVVANVLKGSFDTSPFTSINGVIIVDNNCVVSNNLIYGDLNTCPAIRIFANTSDIIISNNSISGTFSDGVVGTTNRVVITGNLLSGAVSSFASLERISADANFGYCNISNNIVDGFTGNAVTLGSTMCGRVSGNYFTAKEGFTGANGVVLINGGYSGVGIDNRILVTENTIRYSGTTVITSTQGVVYMPTTGGSPYLIISGNTFSPTVFTDILTGNFLSSAKVYNYANTRNTGSDTANAGTFTLSAAATTTIANENVSTESNITITPTNASAATLMSGTASLYISAKTNGVSFAVTTANGSSAAGTETFNYIIV